jgi:AraC-like DNA-binding protein
MKYIIKNIEIKEAIQTVAAKLGYNSQAYISRLAWLI